MLCWTSAAFAQATVYGRDSLGSIGVYESPFGATLSDQVISNVGQNNPTYYLAQNTVPANLDFTASSPVQNTVISSSTPSSSVYSPAAAFDPYAVSRQNSLFACNTVPGTGFSSVSNSGAPPIYSGNVNQFFPETYQAMRRFREATFVDVTYMPKSSDKNGFGFTNVDLMMQLGIPCRFIPNNEPGQSGPGYLYFGPGGSLVWWNPPSGSRFSDKMGFSGFLDFAAMPKFNEVVSVDLGFRFGVYSDFEKVYSKSWRFQGRAIGHFKLSRTVDLAMGVLYLDRDRIKLLPTGGIIWRPQDDWEIRMLFPNPRITKRLFDNGRAQWRVYVQSDYGGDSWSLKNKEIGRFDYNDIRLGGGIEFETITRVKGYFEFGGAFGRELYSHGHREKLNDAIYLKTGIVF